MLGHRLEETSQHSGDQHSELGRSINPNLPPGSRGRSVHPPNLVLSQVLFSSFPLSLPLLVTSDANPRGGPQAMSMLSGAPAFLKHLAVSLGLCRKGNGGKGSSEVPLIPSWGPGSPFQTSRTGSRV